VYEFAAGIKIQAAMYAILSAPLSPLSKWREGLPPELEPALARALSRKAHERPSPLVPNKPTEWQIPLRDRDHVFLKGHRIMVQVQSTWFPIIDRNPQKFVPSIYQARASDYVKATQRVYCSRSFPSRIVLPVVP